MDEFSYLSVLLSVILGLAVTQILQGFRGLVLSRAKVRVYWPVIAWAILLLLICVQHWWSMFGMRNRHNWTFLQFAVVLLNTVFIYMIAGLVFPDITAEKDIDLKASFYSHRTWFFLLAFGGVAVSIGKDFVLDNRLPDPRNLAFQAVFAATLIVGALTRSEAYHKALVVLGMAGFICYIVVLFARLH